MKKTIYLLPLVILLALFTGCSSDSGGPDDPPPPGPGPGTDPVPYATLYDEFSDKGQYNLPTMNKVPARYWTLVDVIGIGDKNDLNQTLLTKGLQYHLLAQSIQGLAHLAVEENRGTIGVWMKDHNNFDSYTLSKQALGTMGMTEIGMQTAVELATNDYTEEVTRLKELWKGSDGKYGYVLSDVKNNPESGNVATVASHVYNAIIVDIRDKTFYDGQGYVMRYDATQKTTANAWADFKDKCNNDALVVMPVATGELRSYAIAHKLFVLNLNKEYGSSGSGQNIAVFDDILRWLKPNAPVLGWEQGVGEDAFVARVTKSGNPMIPADWSYNTDLTALKNKERQVKRVKVINPKTFDYDDTKAYASFFLTDGDNIQWMMNDFNPNWYGDPNTVPTKMSYGLPVYALSMVAPQQLDNLLNLQKDESSILETFGGGYYYIDEYAQNKSRPTTLKEIAKNTANHMRQRNCKILQLTAWDCRNSASIEAYKTFISENDQLEGIVVVQYSPYTGGEGEIFWHKNTAGYHIPIIMTRYAIWNHGSNQTSQGSPAYIASRLNGNSAGTFSAVCVHCWSRFQDIGASNDLTAEMAGNGPIKGASAAQQCAKRLNTDKVKVVSMQELIWQIRMKYAPEETNKYLDSIE